MTEHASDSFTRGLFLGEIHEDMVLPFPRFDPDERSKVEEMVERFRSWAAEHYDARAVEEAGRLPDGMWRELGELGMLGLSVDESFGGQGLSQTGYCKLFEEIGAIDSALAVILGVHQSIGYKAIVMYGTDEQKERLVPDLVAGRKRAGFALTEPNAGSDAYHLETTATLQPDGSYLLEGEKRWIGNGSGDVLTTFARTPQGGHVAVVVEAGMDGFEVGRSYETMGLQANDLRHLYFKGVRIPPDNVLGEEGEGFRIATAVLNTGRMSLGSGAVGGARLLLDLAVEHVTRREQFGQPLADFALVKEKIGWLASYTYGIESMTYLTTGLVDAGVEHIDLESAMVKVSSTEFLWYAANRVFQLAGGRAYMKDEPFEKILRDIRIFPIFEGANDVMRMFVALNGLETVGEELEDLQSFDFTEPIRSLGVYADYVGGRLKRRAAPDRLDGASDALSEEADRCSRQVVALRNASEHLLRAHGSAIPERQGSLKRLADSAADIYAQVATISRVTDVAAGQSGYGDEIEIARVFCRRAADRVDRALGNIDAEDVRPFHRVAEAVYERGGYGHSI
ncbi:MAG: acyl-CoA dehydrogenase family protein [Acidimicrobiia bacterium]